MPERLRWGILGTGRMAATIASELATMRNEGHELVAVASRHLPKALEFAAQHRIPRAVGQYDEIVHDREVDAIYVATPHSLHAANMLACLAGGKAVLCEKPFTLNAGQASAVIAEARRTRLFVMEAMWTRFLPAIDALRGLLAEDAIGQVCLITGGGAFIPERTAGHYLFEKSLGGGVLLDAGVYLVSMVSMILGSPIQVRATARHGDTGVDEQTTMLLGQADGSSAVLYVSLLARRSPDLEILGSRGQIRIEAPLFRPAALTLSDQAGNPGRHASTRWRAADSPTSCGSSRSTPRRPSRESDHAARRDPLDHAHHGRGARADRPALSRRERSASLEEPAMSVVLVTGCSSGLGEAGALAFARAGDTVYASMRDTGKSAGLERLPRRRPRHPHGRARRHATADVRDTVDSIVADNGRLDVLVNNAGMLRSGAFEDLEERAIREVMEVNFFGPSCSRAVLPQMRRQNSGLIIMISSLSGVAGLPGDVAYTASKFAVEGATEALRHEVDRWNIRVALVEAGALRDAHLRDEPAVRDMRCPIIPRGSPYRPLVEHRLRELRARLPDAFDPRDHWPAAGRDRRRRRHAAALAGRRSGAQGARDAAGAGRRRRVTSSCAMFPAPTGGARKAGVDGR